MCIGKLHFLSQTTDFASFVAKFEFIGLLLIYQIEHKIWKPLKILLLSLAFQNLIVPAALDNILCVYVRVPGCFCASVNTNSLISYKHMFTIK